MMDFKALFRECNENLDKAKVLELLNLKEQNGYVLCPSHSDTHPSAKLFKDGWTCYACGASGDLLDFIAKYEGIKAWDALKMVDSYFSLGLLEGKGVRRKVPKKKPDNRKIFREWYKNSILLLSCILRMMRTAYRVFDADEKRYYIVSQAKWIECILDDLQVLAPEESYKIYRKEIETYVTKFYGCRTADDFIYTMGRAETLCRFSENEV